MKKTTLALSIVTALVLWGCGGSSSNDNQPLDKKNDQHQTNDKKVDDKKVDDKTGGDKTGGDKTDGNKTDGNKTDGNKTDGNKTDGNKTDGNKTDGNKTDGNKTDGNKTDGNKTDAGKTDQTAQVLASITKDSVDSEKADNNKKLVENKKKAVDEDALKAAKTASDKAKEGLSEAQKAYDEAKKASELDPSDTKKAETLSKKQKALDDLNEKITDYENLRQQDNDQKAEAAQLKATGKQLETKEKILAAKENKQPQSNLAALVAKLAEEEKAGNADAEKLKSQLATEKLNDAKAKQDTARRALEAAKKLQEGEARDNAISAARKRVEEAIKAKNDASQKAAEAASSYGKAQAEATTAKMIADAKAKADQYRALGSSATNLSLDTFQDVNSVTRNGDGRAAEWEITFKDGSKLNLQPYDISSLEYWIGKVDNSPNPSGVNFYGYLDKDRNTAVNFYQDSAYGYNGDKFFSVGQITPINSEALKATSKASYKGTAFLKTNDAKDVVSTVSATANFSEHSLTGSFSDFKVYDRQNLKELGNTNGSANVKDYKDAKGNGLGIVSFEAKIDGNRFKPQTVEADDAKAKVYGYFYGIDGSKLNPANKLQKEASEIGGLVEYKDFHGAFGAKQSK